MEKRIYHHLLNWTFVLDERRHFGENSDAKKLCSNVKEKSDAEKLAMIKYLAMIKKR